MIPQKVANQLVQATAGAVPDLIVDKNSGISGDAIPDFGGHNTNNALTHVEQMGRAQLHP